MRSSTCGSLCWLLVACAGAPSSPSYLQHPFVGRFADALAFVPQGMDRLMLTDCEVAVPEGERTSARRREVRCGRPADVQASDPADPATAWTVVWSRRQWFEGVTIADYGTAGVPRAELEALGAPQGTVAGHAVRWRGEHEVGLGQTSPATWSTVVDERFLVVANSEALLQSALARPHGDIAATLVREVDIGAGAGWVVFATETGTWTVFDPSCTRVELCWPEAEGPPTDPLELEEGVRVEDLGRRGSNHRWRCFAPRDSAACYTLTLKALMRFGYLITI